MGAMSGWWLFEGGEEMQTSLVCDHGTGGGPGLVWFLSLSSVDVLPFLGHRDPGLPFSVC